MNPTNEDIAAAIESFLEDWDRQAWMANHGEWKSSQWDDARDVYREAVREYADALKELTEECLPDAEQAGGDAASGAQDCLADVKAALEAVRAAAVALADQVKPDEGDSIEEGTIDPGNLSDTAELIDGISERREGWDCVEGWQAHRHGNALVLRWYRDGWGQRHSRDLWVVVDASYFEEA